MKKLYSLLIFLLLVCFGSSSAQYVNYEVKVILDSVSNVKGTLQKVSAEGIAIEDFKGNYHILKAQNIIKIKIRKKGLTFLTSLGGGTGLGLIAGLTVTEELHNINEKLIGIALFTSAGIAGGILTGLFAEVINTKLILLIDKDTQKFKREYLRLEKYSKSYYIEQP